VHRLGRWRWPALLFCALLVGLGIGLPVAVVGYWLVRGLSEGETTSFVLEAVLNSARVSAIAALVTVVASLPLAFLAVRRPGWLSGALEKIAYAGQSIPGITIALALVFFAANYLSPLYQTLGVLVFAYAVRFLPEALGACRGAMVQVDPQTEEAARGLGAGPLRTFLRVTAPQMLPGLSAAALLVFLTAMRELPITLLLSPIGFVTLTTEIWSATSEAFFTRAALPSLLLVLLSLGATALMLRRGALER
jgi:iron(III) transport system permease protein